MDMTRFACAVCKPDVVLMTLMNVHQGLRTGEIVCGSTRCLPIRLLTQPTFPMTFTLCQPCIMLNRRDTSAYNFVPQAFQENVTAL